MAHPPRRGDYEQSSGPESASSSCKLNRRAFLNAVARLNPEVLNSLNKIQRSNRTATADLLPENLQPYLAGEKSDPRFDRFISAVKKWGRRWHLTESWCLEYAMHTALSRTTGDSPKKWCFVWDGALAPSFATGRIHWPDVGNWDPVRQTRIDFVAHAMAFAKASIESYCDKIKTDAKGAGLSKSRLKREAAHFYWLAGHQLLGWGLQQIADADSRSRSTVGEAVNELATSISLKLRESQSHDRGQNRRQTVASIRATMHRSIRTTK